MKLNNCNCSNKLDAAFLHVSRRFATVVIANECLIHKFWRSHGFGGSAWRSCHLLRPSENILPAGGISILPDQVKPRQVGSLPWELTRPGIPLLHHPKLNIVMQRAFNNPCHLDLRYTLTMSPMSSCHLPAPADPLLLCDNGHCAVLVCYPMTQEELRRCIIPHLL